MAIEKLIKSFVQEQLSLIEETKKERFIVDNTNLSANQKDIIIAALDKNPNLLERTIDWNNKPETLSFDDYYVAFKKALTKNLSKLDKGKDYIEIKGDFDDSLMGVYIPLTWEGSKVIASNKIGVCRGEWCTAHSDSPIHWNYYNFTEKSILVYFIYFHTKYAVKISIQNSTIWYTFDENDNPKPNGCPQCDIPGVDVGDFIKKYHKVINDARETIMKTRPIDEVGGFKGESYKINSDGSVDVNGDVQIGKDNLIEEGNVTKVAVKFNHVSGSFSVSAPIDSLDNCPVTVDGNFILSNTRITSLKGSPRVIKSGFYLRQSTTLESLIGCPDEVESFYVNGCDKLTEIDALPKVQENINITDTRIKRLSNLPKHVNGNLMLGRNMLDSLEGCPDVVDGHFSVEENLLRNLKNGPTSVKLDYTAEKNHLMSLEGCPQKLRGSFNVRENFLEDLSNGPETTGNYYADFNAVKTLSNFTTKVEGSFYVNQEKSVFVPRDDYDRIFNLVGGAIYGIDVEERKPNPIRTRQNLDQVLAEMDAEGIL